MGMFSKPKPPPIASDNDAEVQKKKAEMLAMQEKGGIKSTILTSPTGVTTPGYNTNLGGSKSLLG